MVPPPTPYGILFPKVRGSQPTPKTPIVIIPDKATNLKFWQENSQGPSEQKRIKNFGEKGAWAYIKGLPKFLGTSNYLRNGWSTEATNFKFDWNIPEDHPNKSR